MESKAKLFGHPVHPMLVTFPLGLLATSLIFDLISLGARDPHFSNAAEYLIGAGVLGGLVAAVPGAIDWFAIPSGTRAKRIGLWHGSINFVVVVLFAVNWVLRLPSPANPPSAAIVLSIVAVVGAVIAGWLGGELVDRLGVGVDDGANLNAPNSRRGPIPRGAEPPERRAA